MKRQWGGLPVRGQPGTVINTLVGPATTFVFSTVVIINCRCRGGVKEGQRKRVEGGMCEEGRTGTAGNSRSLYLHLSERTESAKFTR